MCFILVDLIKENKKIQIAFAILVFVVLIIIFNFSNQNGEKSEGLSQEISRQIAGILRLDEGLTDDELQVLIGKIDHIIRKLAHFCIYTLLGIVLMLFLSTTNLTNKKRILIAIVFGLLYAASDEIHQVFISDRIARVSDVLIDTLGVMFGIFIVSFIKKIKAPNQ